MKGRSFNCLPEGITDNDLSRPVSKLRFLSALVGIGCFLAWQDVSLSFLYPLSAGWVFSPLLFSDLAGVLLLILSIVSFCQDQARLLSLAVVRVIATLGVVLATAVGCLLFYGIRGVSEGNEGIILIVASVIGLSLAVITYLWATVLMEYTERNALLVVFAALALGSGLQLIILHLPPTFVLSAYILVGAVTLLCCLVSLKYAAYASSPLLFRPSQNSEFLKLMGGVVLYSAAMGITAGSTAASATNAVLYEINSQTALISLMLSLVLLTILVTLRRRLNLLTALRVFTPGLVTIVLLNIIIESLAGVWLSFTFFAALVLRLLVLLVVVVLARRSFLSLPVLFPIIWSLLSLGHGAGVLFGQNVAEAGIIPDINIFYAVVALVAILIVCSSTLLSASRFVLDLGSAPKALPELPDGDNAETGGERGRDSRGSDGGYVTSDSDFIARCEAVAQKYRLSTREFEVLSLLARGHTRLNVAKRLFISENTVRSHVKSIYGKLHIHSKQQLIDCVERRRPR